MACPVDSGSRDERGVLGRRPTNGSLRRSVGRRSSLVNGSLDSLARPVYAGGLMCRLWAVMFLFGVAVTIAVADAVSRIIEEDQERRRLNRKLIRECRDGQCPMCLCTLGACRGHADGDEFCQLCHGHAVVTLGN